MFGSLLFAVAFAATSVSAAAVPCNYTADSFIGEKSPSTNLHARAPGQVITQCTVPGTAALTFDDGPWWFLYDISKQLIAEGGKGTFFFNGGSAGCIYNADQAKRVKYAFDKGHQVASHTWSHKDLATLNWDQIHHEFWLVEEALMKITGAYPAFVRPPYGSYNDLVKEVARVRGQAIALWDFDSNDWQQTADQINAQYTSLANSRPSSVLALNHEVYQHTAHVVVPHAIRVLKNAGYRLVTLAECVGQQPYQWVGNPFPRDATWTCEGK
ncbi:chitin deacetylase [Coprinopsis cinerea okayama7|uniref:Chitin deacetylase n=1 Tax=Coprinopsis cinerea (strain Okayama-7 / 130 / ATCC MYA-4618 / FGSC 9003) TaxID=240176 RepID=A8P3L1_COPC7|nr:chitin deacetylase [Coprinopsis cinerea okayama7\|eukprot:XP_001838568.2 chitin deacetylase [Coprinopsis cinerea okayama7\